MDREQLLSSLRSYDPNFDESKVNKAIDFAVRYHGSQLRESGDPYYYHPLEVASIIIEMRLDTSSIITAILHDTVEDTDLSLEEIEQHFGSEIAKLVDGVTKLTKIEFMPDHVRQAENFRKLLVAMSEDIRVLLVKLADRLHNMRTISFVKTPEKRMRIALETMEIYAPLAERIGVQQIKIELQDICFKVLQPEIRESIINRFKDLYANESLIDNIINEIQNTLIKNNIKGKVFGRHKTPYSIWMKMKQKNIALEQLFDIIAFRIIVNNINECYQTLGVIHTVYQMVPGNYQDFISTPKNNGYQSLHSIVLGPFQQKIEIQIRTQEMHEIAELGVAAHWRYKQKYDASDGRQYRWIRELLTILEQTNDPEEFLQNTKLAMHYNQVFCFTPKGNLIALPKGATTVDFAYILHSDIGNHCVGAKINGRIVPLRTVIENGDQVEIITAKNQHPSPSWEKFVVTGKARAEIKKFVQIQQKDQYVKLGQALFEKSIKSFDFKNNLEAIDKACIIFKRKNSEELFFAIGRGTLACEEVIKQLTPKKNRLTSTLSLLTFKKKKSNANQALIQEENAMPIKGLISGMAMHFAGCCHPIFGDQIVGVIHSGSGVTIHTADCEMLDNYNSMMNKIIDLTWDNGKSSIPLICRLKILLLNEPGSLADLTREISKEHCNITNLKITNRNQEFFEILLDIEVYNAVHIDNIINSLKSKRTIHDAERFKT